MLEAHSRATSNTASGFIDVLLERMPFPIKAIQVDGGSEFQDVFEEECQRRGIKLFVLPPRSPKLNGHVERAQRTHTEEFYEVTDTSFELPELNQALLKWEKVYKIPSGPIKPWAISHHNNSWNNISRKEGR